MNWTRREEKTLTRSNHSTLAVFVILFQRLLKQVMMRGRKSVQQAPKEKKKQTCHSKLLWGKKKSDSEKEPVWFGLLSSAFWIPVHKTCCDWKRWREGEEDRTPLIHLASLCCCLGPVVTSEIEDEHERELQRSPFTDSKKSAPNYFECKYQLKQAASAFFLSPSSRLPLQTRPKRGMGWGPAAIWVPLWWIEHGTYANSPGLLASTTCILTQQRLHLECAVVAVRQNA